MAVVSPCDRVARARGEAVRAKKSAAIEEPMPADGASAGSMRSRHQPSILTFLAQDADSQVFCYSNADIRKGEEAEEIFRFIAFWKRQYGSLPRHLVFDYPLGLLEACPVLRPHAR
jgi:hypothetical protein